jgi:hypothetical protein
VKPRRAHLNAARIMTTRVVDSTGGSKGGGANARVFALAG